MAKQSNRSVVKRVVAKVLIGLVGLFVLIGAYGGVYSYYQLYFMKTGVQLNNGKQLTRSDLLDMVLISAVKQAQEQNTHSHEPEPVKE